MIKVLFFARIREQLDTGSMEVDAIESMTAGNVREQLASTDDVWAKTMKENNLLVAVNQEITDWDHKIKDGDEVAFFPPVTGG